MDVRRLHVLPLGSTIESDGRVRVQPWAPQAQRIELCLVEGAGDTCLDMTSQGSG